MQYTARVEIHNGSYDQLHTAMALESFSRNLTSGGKQYHMPIGEYWKESSGDAWAILADAKRAALSVDANANIVVSGDPRIVFYNCTEVVPEMSSWSNLYAAMLAGRK